MTDILRLQRAIKHEHLPIVKHHSISQDNMKMIGHSFSGDNIAAYQSIHYQGIYYSRGDLKDYLLPISGGVHL